METKTKKITSLKLIFSILLAIISLSAFSQGEGGGFGGGFGGGGYNGGGYNGGGYNGGGYNGGVSYGSVNIGGFNFPATIHSQPGTYSQVSNPQGLWVISAPAVVVTAHPQTPSIPSFPTSNPGQTNTGGVRTGGGGPTNTTTPTQQNEADMIEDENEDEDEDEDEEACDESCEEEKEECIADCESSASFARNRDRGATAAAFTLALNGCKSRPTPPVQSVCALLAAIVTSIEYSIIESDYNEALRDCASSCN